MDSDILKKGFGLFEIVVVLAVMATLIAIVAVSSSKQRQIAQAERTLNELIVVSSACTQYYNDNGAWPANLAALRPKYLSAQSDDSNVFGNLYIITGDTNQITISTTIPSGFVTKNSFGPQITVVTSGNNDIISVTRPITTGNWRLKYDKKYLYNQ